MSRLNRITMLFCLLMTVSFAFSYFFFRAYIKSQKTSFRKELSITAPDAVRSIHFSKEQLYHNTPGMEWTDDNKELVIGGRYYDIISLEESGNMIAVKIICDEKESSLFDSFFARHKKGQDFLISFLKLFQFVEKIQGPLIQEIISFELHGNNFFAAGQFQLSDFQSSLIKPPSLV